MKNQIGMGFSIVECSSVHCEGGHFKSSCVKLTDVAWVSQCWTKIIVDKNRQHAM